MSDDFATYVEHMALVLSRLPVRLARDLEGAEPLTQGWTSVTSLDGRVVFNGDREHDDWRPTPRDLSRPVRSSLLFDINDSRAYFGAFALRAACKEDLRSVGRVPFLSPQPHLRATIGMVRAAEGGANEWSHHFASYHARERRWVQWGQGYTLTKGDQEEWFDRYVGNALALQFTQRYDWRVMLGYGTGARVALATTPAEARKLFRARELPAGKERRAALRHWVTSHYRRVEGTKAPVRSHFRGAERFEWDGLQCEIIPSEYERDHVGQLPK